jgi:hypothetical protein
MESMPGLLSCAAQKAMPLLSSNEACQVGNVKVDVAKQAQQNMASQVESTI